MEPVTDDIAPGYSAIISTPMDLTTMATKVEANLYSSVKEYKVHTALAVMGGSGFNRVVVCVCSWTSL